MKRQAPTPPANSSNLETSNLTHQQKEQLITNITKLQTKPDHSIPDVVCNDTLKLESGVLKSVKESISLNKPLTKSPISPKPWYKRTLSGSNRDSIISHKKETKHLDEEESFAIKYAGIKETQHSKFSSVLSRFSITSSDERKKDENRKSGLSMLANISELDREAALIVQQEQSKVQAQLDEKNESYYSPSNSQNDVPSFLQNGGKQNGSKRGGARELISKFNALTNAASRISVNSVLFPKEAEHKRRFSFQSQISNESLVTPPMKRSIFKLEEFNEIKEEEIKVVETKVLNTPPNILKYFEPKKVEEVVKVEEEVKIEVKPIENIEPIKKDGWTCTRCTLENNRMDVKCVVCGMWKPFAKSNIEKYLPTLHPPANVAKIENKLERNAEIAGSNTKLEARTFAENVFAKNNIEKYLPAFHPPKVEEKTIEKIMEKENNTELDAKSFAEHVFAKKNIENYPPKLEEKIIETPKLDARTFAENVFKVVEMENEVKEEIVGQDGVNLESELSLDDLRKARLARFSQNMDDIIIEPEETNTDKVEKAKEINNKLSEEQKKLRQMLKEMHDALPKGSGSRKSTMEKEKPIEEPPIDVSKGAIPKTKPIIVDEILKPKDLPKEPKEPKDPKEKTITAIFITKETTYENIKIRKENTESDKPIKVSASSQTQSPKVTLKPPTGTDKVILPSTIEEITRKPLSRVNSFSKGTFELIRAKDFAGITSTATTPDSPLYANLPATLESMEANVTQMPTSTSQQSFSSSDEELLLSSEGIKDFKATLRQDKHNANTLAINRLLRRLESAIASGQHVQASKLAKDLARLKVNCSVTRQKRMDSPNVKYIT